jgi:hypothetical protein
LTRSPSPQGALLAAKAAGYDYVNIDGTLIETDRHHAGHEHDHRSSSPAADHPNPLFIYQGLTSENTLKKRHWPGPGATNPAKAIPPRP